MKKVLLTLCSSVFIVVMNTISVCADIVMVEPEEMQTLNSVDLDKILLISGILTFVVCFAVAIVIVINYNKN